MKYFIIDGNSIMNRAYYGIRSTLTNKDGMSTGAIYGFLNIYLKNIKEIKPDVVAAAFDLKEPTFRHKADENYKANRKPMDEALALQMPYIKEILKSLGVKVFEVKGFEADDVIGTFAKYAESLENECHILTGDRDILQLVTSKTTVHIASSKGDISYTPEKFFDEYGFEPINLIDFKAISGDPSDNYKGVAGIGQKGASDLIKEFATVENIYDNLESDKIKPKIKAKLEAGREDAKMCKWLASISTAAPIEKDESFYLNNTKDEGKLKGLLLELGLNSIISKLGLEDTVAKTSKTETKKTEIPEIKTGEGFDLNSFKDKKVYYIFENGELSVLCDNTIYETSISDEILNFFESETEKVTTKAKPHYRYAFKNKRKLNKIIFDACICGYLLSPLENDYSLESLVSIFNLNLPITSRKDKLIALYALYSLMLEKIKSEGLEKLFYEIELPLTEVLASMEDTGVLVDSDKIKEFGKELETRAKETEETIFQLSGEKFNILSPKQLGTVLFEKMGLPHAKKTKTGYSTNAEVLENLANISPVASLVLEYRQLKKLSSTYVDGLLKEINPDDKRIHTNFKQTETRTGRISSTEPNLQNIPVRTELGKNMRKFFVAKEGNVLVDADYSQIELRVLSNISGDENMQNAFLSGKDIHTQTASQVLGLPEEMITSEMRSAAKAVNFGIIYGIGAFSLSKDINVSVAKAKEYINNYLANYPKVSEFMEKTVEFAKKNGYVTTEYGRIRPIPEILSKNKIQAAAGKRIAMNTPVQGTAADIIKLAMIKVSKRLEREVPRARLILQIHDELIVETPSEYGETVKKILEEEMVGVSNSNVALRADANIGKSWYEAKK